MTWRLAVILDGGSGRNSEFFLRFATERCTKIQPYGEYNKDYEVTLGCTSLHPNFSPSSQNFS